MALNTKHLDLQSAAEKAVSVIGNGYDLCCDLRFTACKPGPSGSTLIELDQSQTRDLIFPGGVIVPNVSTSIKCDKGERTRFRSDVLSFVQMSEHFNRELSISGKIPSGLFNSMFDMKNGWQKDAASTKSLALEGWFITLYNVELVSKHITLSESVRNEVPTSWDPAAIAEFIEKYGTHIIIGVKMGGKDVVHLKQLQSSELRTTEVQKLLKQLADQRFSENLDNTLISNPAELSGKLKDDRVIPRDAHRPLALVSRPSIRFHSKNDDIVSISVRRGGIDVGQDYNLWLSTISKAPNVISMTFVPITSLLSGVPGNGFLSHAMNLYLRYKPPIEELQQFLEFQLPRQWAPVYGDLPLCFGQRRRKNLFPYLQFSFVGPKLYVNTTQVDTGNRPVTGIRLYLEGKKSDQLAVHLQHLVDLPGLLEILDDHGYEVLDEPVERGFYKSIKSNMFSHVCTAPVEYNGARIDESASIVTNAWLEVKVVGMKKILFLRMGFSMVASAKIRRSEWDEPSNFSRKSGIFSSLISSRLISKELNQPEEPAKVDINSAVFHGKPPVPTRAPKMLNFVNTKEMIRGPEHPPGYWVVTGAKLDTEGGKISLKVKYSLLTIMSEESLLLMRGNEI